MLLKCAECVAMCWIHYALSLLIICQMCWTKVGYYFVLLINWSINEYAILCFLKMFPVTNILLHTIYLTVPEIFLYYMQFIVLIVFLHLFSKIYPFTKLHHNYHFPPHETWPKSPSLLFLVFLLYIKGYLTYYLHIRNLIISLNVIFNEDHSPYLHTQLNESNPSTISALPFTYAHTDTKPFIPTIDIIDISSTLIL